MTSVLGAYGTWDKQRKDDTVTEHLPLVYRMAQRVVNATHLGTVELGDFVNVGVIALYKALEKFDGSRGVPLGAFAAPYIRGAMLDEVQRHRQLPRSIRDKHSRIKAAYDTLSQKFFREPTDAELAEHLGITDGQLGEWFTDVAWTTVWSLDELEENGGLDVVDERMDGSPETSFHMAERKSEVAAAIRRLSQREQQVLYAYYQEELTLKEIGYVLDISESQVSRIHSKAILRLRAMVSDGD